VVYPDDSVRLAVSRAVAVETTRGWRLTKEKASHKIDVVVALAMAAHACVQRPQVDYNKIPWVVPFYSGRRRYIPGQSHGEMITTVIDLLARLLMRCPRRPLAGHRRRRREAPLGLEQGFGGAEQRVCTCQRPSTRRRSSYRRQNNRTRFGRMVRATGNA
jgi:hypothetical protein